MKRKRMRESTEECIPPAAWVWTRGGDGREGFGDNEERTSYRLVFFWGSLVVHIVVGTHRVGGGGASDDGPGSSALVKLAQ